MQSIIDFYLIPDNYSYSHGKVDWFAQDNIKRTALFFVFMDYFSLFIIKIVLKRTALFFVFMDYFSLCITKIEHKKSKSRPSHLHSFYAFFAATRKDINIVKLNRIILCSCCLQYYNLCF